MLGVLLVYGDLVIFFVRALVTPIVLRQLIIVLGPFALASYLASVYLQDIFELEKNKIARRFIMQAALASRYSKIHLREGNVAKKELESPIIQIGGPGYVQVELDSAALFEKADGTPRVIGPTLKEPSNFAVLDGFERLREVIDLRDIKTDPVERVGRSKDGIPVRAKDVRLIHSVARGGQKPTLEHPHPFVEEAILNLGYQQTARVAPQQKKNTSRNEYWKQNHKRWISSLPGLINGSLGNFIAEHSISEFLANISKTELESLYQLEEENRNTSENIAPHENGLSSNNREEVPPAFTPRPKITGLFFDFASGFPHRAENKGGHLEWIGLGTWSTPASAQLISEHHLEAWRISRDNYARGHKQTLQQLRLDAALHEKQKLLQELITGTINKTLEPNMPHEEIVRQSLLAYRDRISRAYQLYIRDKRVDASAPDPPKKLVAALRILNKLLSHKV
ncbi:MAG: hypothetical protein ABIJ39_14135 [Chloroflexota bacterium]